MKPFLTISLALLLTAGLSSPVFAQVEQGVKNRAKALRDANNARQGVVPPQPGTPAPGAPTPPAGPQGIDPAQQANIDKVEADISGIHPGNKIADDYKKKMQDDVLVLAKGAIKPSPQALTNLVNHLSVALTGQDVSLLDPAPAQLARDINIVVNSVRIPSGTVSTIITAAQNLLRAAHVTEDNYKAVVADLKAIVAELQKNKGK